MVRLERTCRRDDGATKPDHRPSVDRELVIGHGIRYIQLTIEQLIGPRVGQRTGQPRQFSETAPILRAGAQRSRNVLRMASSKRPALPVTRTVI